MATARVRTALSRLRTAEDERLAIREEFLTPVLGGERTVGVLSSPLHDRPAMGWVICHSFGQDQIYLQPTEAALARDLAAAGFSVFRFHSQGYGDSHLTADHVTLDSHLHGVRDAVTLLAEELEGGPVGVFGARFGAMVAGLVADELQLPACMLWEPVVSGRRYARSLARLSAMTDLVTGGRLPTEAISPAEIMERTGVLDVQGFPLTSEAFRQISSVELTERLSRFVGTALIVQISRSTEPRHPLMRLVDRLRELGAEVRFDVLSDPSADRFGGPRFRGLTSGTKIDSQAALVPRLVSDSVSWASRLHLTTTTSTGER